VPLKPLAGVYVILPVEGSIEVEPFFGEMLKATELGVSVDVNDPSFASTSMVTAVSAGVLAWSDAVFGDSSSMTYGSAPVASVLP
jgi:hypothetical protein